MPKIVEFNVPTKNGMERATGIPIWFKIGDRKVKFVLQYSLAGEIMWLTHFASGRIFGHLNDAAVELMCKLSPYHRFTKRKLAEFLIQKAVTKFGVDGVLEKIDSVPVINLKGVTEHEDRNS